MALRALLFSKNPETAETLVPILKESGFRVEVCSDIFAAIEKGTKQPFSCVIADWSDQPEAGFLLKRARESGPNRGAVAIAIVEGDPSPEDEREHRLEYLFYRPLTADEVQAVLAKARQQMQLHSTAFETDANASLDHPEFEHRDPAAEDPNLLETAADLPAPEDLPIGSEEEEFSEEAVVRRAPRDFSKLRNAVAVLAVVAAGFLLWKAQPVIHYLATTREGAWHVLQDSVASLFYSGRSSTQSVTVITDAQQDAYFSRTASATNGSNPSPGLGVISTEAELPDAPRRLPPAFDFPLPTPEFHPDPTPVRQQRAQIPESLRSSAPISRPVVLTVNPAQMMPVSTPPPPVPQYGEPVHLTEEAARSLALQTVDPVYPPEARPQKLQGAVVLQATIGRDGSVQDVKLVRGYFVLAKAAIAAVKQWRFRPSTINGRPVEAQTVITLTFSYPAS